MTPTDPGPMHDPDEDEPGDDSATWPEPADDPAEEPSHDGP